MWWFPIFAEVIPKYQIQIDSILLNKKNTTRGMCEASDKLYKLMNDFLTEYKLNSDPFSEETIKYFQNIKGTQTHTDIKETLDYFYQGIDQCLSLSENSFDPIMNSIAKISDTLKEPLIIIIIALFLPLTAKYGFNIISWLVKQTASNDKVALGVTAFGLGIIMLLSTLVW